MNAYVVELIDRGPRGYRRSVVCKDRATALDCAQALINAQWDNLKPTEDRWADRSACLYGNTNQTREQWEVFKWVDLWATDRELMVQPFRIHDNGKAASYLLRD